MKIQHVISVVALSISSLTLIGCGGGSDNSNQTAPPNIIPPVVDIPDETLDHQGEMKILEAYIVQKSGFQVQSTGIVHTLLPDDTQGTPHQKFILSLPSGHTLLIAHNIELAPRVPNLREGDKVQFYGEYEWNHQGGVIHWTHKDPKQKHPDGWLKVNNVKYE
ncbi:DUF3465 domain-containing protein [Photobacterium damselae]|uniref:DUF3465 domain-containing protein n=1 Tax=Photobacterium damselae TaxID=38293 RepID=UPI00406825DE